MGIKRNYHLSHRLIAYILFISLFLQSCGGFQNQIVPQEKKQPSRPIELSDNPLINTDKKIVTSGGYLASFYEDDGELRANLKVDEKQPKPNYKGVRVLVEEGTSLASLTKLDSTTQQSRIELNRSHSGQLSHITIRKGGLSGGMRKVPVKKGDEDQPTDNDVQYQQLLENAKKGKDKDQFLLGEYIYNTGGDINEALHYLLAARAQNYQPAISLIEKIKKEHPELIGIIKEKEYEATRPAQAQVTEALPATQSKQLIIHQLEKLSAHHAEDESLKAELKKMIRHIENSSSQTPLLDFKKSIQAGDYALPEYVKKSLLGFVALELSSLGMEGIKSQELNSDEILGYIKEGKVHAEKAKNQDMVIFVGNTGAGKSTMINALAGCKMVRGRYFAEEDRIIYEEESLFDLPEMKKLDSNTLLKLKNRIKGWDNDLDTIEVFLGLLWKEGIKETSKIRALAQRAIDKRNEEESEQEAGKRVILVDDRNEGKSAVARIGHAENECTFYPEVILGDHPTLCDCPGFIGTSTKEIEIANSVNTIQTLTQARSVKAAIMINYYTFLVDRARGLSELWGILQKLFGDSDNIIKYRNSILINISQVPEVGDARFPNSLPGILGALKEKGEGELIPLLERVVMSDPLNSSLCKGNIPLKEFLEKIHSSQPIRNPHRVFRTAMSEGTRSALKLFANEAKDDIEGNMEAGDFKRAYNKLHYLTQLSALKDSNLDNKIEEIKKSMRNKLALVAETIYEDRGIETLIQLAQQLYEGIVLDRVLGVDIIKDACFKAHFFILKNIINQPVFSEEMVNQAIQSLYYLMNYFDVPRWSSMIQDLINNLFFKGNQAAIFPNMKKKAKELFGVVNQYLAANQEARYGVLRVKELEDISRLAQIPKEEIFKLLKEAHWLEGQEGAQEANVVLSAEELLSSAITLPSQLSDPAVKKAIFTLFEEHIIIDTFFAKNFIQFKEGQQIQKSKLVQELFDIVQNKKEEANKIYQIRHLVSQHFSHKEAARYLKFLSYLKLLNHDLASERHRLLSNIVENFRVLNKRLSDVGTHVPVGSIHMMPSVRIPVGFRECNGDWLPIKSYSALYHVLLGTFGLQETQDGEKQFRLPDYRGYFLRGMEQGRLFQTAEEDATRLPHKQFTMSNGGNHSHSGSTSVDGNHNHYDIVKENNNTSFYWYWSGGDYRLEERNQSVGSHSHSLNINLAGDHYHFINGGGDDETRPKNYPVMYVIKY